MNPLTRAVSPSGLDLYTSNNQADGSSDAPVAPPRLDAARPMLECPPLSNETADARARCDASLQTAQAESRARAKAGERERAEGGAQ